MWKHFSQGFWRLDEWLIYLSEIVCHWLQRLTGRTNFWICGKLSLGILVCIVCCEMAFFAHYDSWWIRALGFMTPSRFSSTVMIIAGGLVGSGHIFYCLDGWKQAETAANFRLAYGLANPRKQSLGTRMVRYLAVFVLLVGPSVWFTLVTVAMYLEACDPLPPCQGKVKEWLRKLSLRLRPVSVSG